MTEPTWIVLLPPVLAIVLAIWTKQVYLSLFMGIYLGWTILAGWNPFVGLAQALEGIVRVFENGGNTKVILFMLMVGALITLMQRSGGVTGFVDLMARKGLLSGRRSSQLMAALIGCLIFIETSVSCLIVGAVSRPIFDRNRISREKLAYICDSTSAPINVLIPFNAWGAFIIGLLSQAQVAEPVWVMLAAVLLNFYPLLTVALVYILILTAWDFGPMKAAERRVREEGRLYREGAHPVVAEEIVGIEDKAGVQPRALNLVLPVLTLVISMPAFMLITGNGDITAGSGSTSVFWAVFTAIAVTAGSYLAQRIMTLTEVTDLVLKGMGGLVPLALLMLFAFAIGDVTRELQTGEYVAQLAKLFLHPVTIPAILFVTAGFISFATGTSWGTFAIMVPIAVPTAATADISLPLVVAAVLGGGIFGDHSSPISDTTMVSSMAAASDHIDHVRTQLPYALTAAAVTTLLYFLIAGIAR